MEYSPTASMGPSNHITKDSSEASQFPQAALLDFFFPGFSVFASAVHKYLHIDLNLYIPLLLLFGALTVAWNYTSQYFWDQLESYFMSSVDIRTDDEIYNILMAWVAAQRFAQGARRFVVNTNLNSRSWYLWRWEDDEGDEDSTESTSESKAKKKALSYTPSFGSHYFWYRGRLLLFKRNSNREQASYMVVSEREEISISCFGRNPWILKELLHEAKLEYMKKDEQKTLIYQGTCRGSSSEPTWQRCMARTSRPFSTVILKEKTKKDLIDDVSDYLDPATRRWYANRGIPYRRGYLLYGPPGTGKSSLSLALAGFFKMRIYIVSLSSVTANEENLATLFAELPRRCVVLLEDIDTAGLTHTREENKNPVQNPDNQPMVPGQVTPGNGTTTTGRLSLSGLLNILDGVASQEGRVLIMTTNHMEKLDKALIRPGRVDMIVEFGLADRDMITAIFRAIYAPLEGDESAEAIQERLNCADPGKRQALVDAATARKAAQDKSVQELAESFADKIPSHEFSPAEIQGHLMRHKRDAQAAVTKAEEWVEQARKEKKEKELEAAEEKRKAEEDEKKKAEEDKKKAEEEKKKAEEEKKKTEKEEKKDKKRKDAKKSKKRSAKKAASDAESASDSDSSSSSSSSSGSEWEVEEKKSSKKKSKSKKYKDDSLEKQSAADKASLSPVGVLKDSLKVESKHERKDSGYGTPASVEA